MNSQPPGPRRRLLTGGEVANLFRVDPRTVVRWANEGRLPCIKTLGGHRRFYEDEVRAALEPSEFSSQTDD